MSDETRYAFILAEYCPGPFYDGWWLYERDTNDGRKTGEFGSWGWLRDDYQQKKAHDLCVCMGYEPPPVTRHGQDFYEWYAATFPNGLRVHVGEYNDYELEEIVERRPKQRRRNIRTIRGAAMSDRAAERRART